MSRRQQPESEPTPTEDADPVSVCRNLVLRRLTRAPQTRHQLEQYLARKSTDPDVVAQVLDRMAEVGLVDDQEFAAMWVRSRRQVRGSGPSALRQELQLRGVHRDLIDAAVAERPGDDYEIALDLATRKLASLSRFEPAVQERRILSLLIRRGYDGGVAYRVVREVCRNPEIDS